MIAAIAFLTTIVLLPASVAATRDPLPLGPSASGLRAADPSVTILRLEDRREFGVDLLALLSSPDAEVRARAALAAGRIGDARAIDPLAAVLRDSIPRVRAQAAFALGELEDSAAALPLALLLGRNDEHDPHVRALAVEGLGKLRAGRFAPACVAALSDTSSEVIEAAALASWQMQASDAWKDLVRLTSEPAAGDALRGKAVYALMRMLGAANQGRTPISGGASLPEDARSRIRAALIARIDDPDLFCRLSAVRGLGSFGDDETRRMVRGALADSDWRVRVEAIRALAAQAVRREEADAAGGGTESESGRKDLVGRGEGAAAGSGEGTAEGGEPAVEGHGGEIATGSGADDLSLLLSALDDPNPNVRLTAIEAMGRGFDPGRAIGTLRSLLERTDLSDRERELASLTLAACWESALETASPDGAENIRTAISDLAQSLAQRGSWSLRAAAAEVIDPNNAADRELLDRLLRDEARVAKAAVEPVLRWKASSRPAGQTVLAAMQSRLDWLLASPDPVLRAIAIETAGTILADSIYSERAGEAQEADAVGADSSAHGTAAPPTAAGQDSSRAEGSGPSHPAPAGTPSSGESNSLPADKHEWVALLVRRWERAREERANDEALTIVGQLERLTDDPAARTILDDALSSRDAQVHGTARRILSAEGLAGSTIEPPIETGRSRGEYATIARWDGEDHLVEIRTSKGIARIRLFSDEAPLTCWNFVRLAESGFYDRGRWHRIVPDFVVQDGCPRGDGYGGPGYAIRCEINERRFVTGAVGMALSGKDTGGSQFFICHSPQPHLDGRYTVFGQVVDGMEVFDSLIQGDAIESIRPVR